MRSVSNVPSPPPPRVINLCWGLYWKRLIIWWNDGVLCGGLCHRGRPAVKPSWMSGDVSAAPPSALEVVSFIGKTVGAGAALTAAVYLLRKVCLIMAWKSGGASHAELVNNLRSKSWCFLSGGSTDAFTDSSPENGLVWRLGLTRERWLASWLLSYVVCCCWPSVTSLHPFPKPRSRRGTDACLREPNKKGANYLSLVCSRTLFAQPQFCVTLT